MEELQRRVSSHKAVVFTALRTRESKSSQEVKAYARSGERRREVPRIDMSQAAQLITHEGRVISVRFLDLSRCGFKIRHSDDLVEEDLVTIVSARGSRARGEIKWVADRLAGGIFVEAPQDL